MTQNEKVLALLRAAGRDGVSALDMLSEAGTYRAAARVSDLRAMGHRIDTIERPGKVAVYVLRTIGWACITCGAALPAGAEPIPTATADMGRGRCWGCGAKDALFRRKGAAA